MPEIVNQPKAEQKQGLDLGGKAREILQRAREALTPESNPKGPSSPGLCHDGQKSTIVGPFVVPLGERCDDEPPMA